MMLETWSFPFRMAYFQGLLLLHFQGVIETPILHDSKFLNLTHTNPCMVYTYMFMVSCIGKYTKFVFYRSWVPFPRNPSSTKSTPPKVLVEYPTFGGNTLACIESSPPPFFPGQSCGVFFLLFKYLSGNF